MNSFEGEDSRMERFRSNVHGSHSSSTTTAQATRGLSLSSLFRLAKMELVLWSAKRSYRRLDVATGRKIHDHALYRLCHGRLTNQAKEVLIKILKGHIEFKKKELLILELRALIKIPDQRNILKAIGWSRDSQNNYLVVHECMPHGTLYSNLHSRDILPCDIRYRVSCELASVILHLQKERILHRDITSKVVMLDLDYAAKLTSFVLAKFTVYGKEKTELIQIPKLINNPEYIREGVVTPAFDVYSFGMVLLEIATGMNADDILGKLCKPSKRLELRKAADQWLDEEYEDQMERVFLAGLCCVLPPKQSRPPLEDIVDYLKDGRGHEIVSSFIDAHSVVFRSVHIPESFDIGIPHDYPLDVLLREDHRWMIGFFLMDLHDKLSKKVTFEEIKKNIKCHTSSLMVADAPLRNWNSLAQLILQRTKEIEHFWHMYEEKHQRLVGECTAAISQYRTILNDAEGESSSSR